MTYPFRKVRYIIVLVLFLSAMLPAQNPVPFLTQPLIPDAIAPAPPGLIFALTVNGTGFVPGATVNWNGSPRFTRFVSASRLIAFIVSSDISVPTTAWITVANPGPGGGVSNVLFLPVHNPASKLAFQRTDYLVGHQTQFAATADFRGNRILDLAVATTTEMISIFLGNGDGTFQPQTDYDAGPCPVIPVIGDFNRDGILDLAVPLRCPWEGGVSVLLGRGDGTFQSPIQYAAGYGPAHGLTADFNGDGKLDLAVLNNLSEDVSILLGNGDGSFQPPMDFGVGQNPIVVAAGDFDGDGKLDLVVSNYNSRTASVLLGNGDGTFRPRVDYAVGLCPAGVAVADFNGDEKLDLVVASECEPWVFVLLGNGDGTFRPPMRYAHSRYGAFCVEIADFNADGKLDLGVSTFEPALDILLGNGDGAFERRYGFPVGEDAWSAVPADFNRDGLMDAATSSYTTNSISVLVSQPAAP